MNCKNCGAEIQDGNSFCPKCGAGEEIKKQEVPPADDNMQTDSEQQKNSEDFWKKGNQFVANALGVEKLEGFSFSKFFRQLFRHHSWDEMEEMAAVGTKKTTPPLSDISTDWPAPWFFFRFFVFIIAAFLIVVWRIDDLGKQGEYAPMILLLLGIVGIPLTALFFFFEINILKNISIMQVGKLVCIGGFISVLIALFIFPVFKPSSAIWAGPIEETAKGVVMLLFIRNLRYKYKLNGLLIGASIGVGFAIIETAGYIVRDFLNNDVPAAPVVTMFVRAFFAPVGHVLYSALVGYALWRARKNGRFALSKLADRRTVTPIALAIALHMFWNSSLLEKEGIIKGLIVAFCGYGAVIYLLQDCMKEIRNLRQEIQR